MSYANDRPSAPRGGGGYGGGYGDGFNSRSGGGGGSGGWWCDLSILNALLPMFCVLFWVLVFMSKFNQGYCPCGKSL